MRNVKKAHFDNLGVCSENIMLNIQMYFEYTNCVSVPIITVLARSPTSITRNYLEDRNSYAKKCAEHETRGFHLFL